jgi:O-antigen/teichoic acid export membrane protein
VATADPNDALPPRPDALTELTPPEPPAPEPQTLRLGAMGGYALIYAAVTILGKAVGFLLLPVVTHYLLPPDYGVIELVNLTLDIISIVAGTRLLGGMFRYYHKAEGAEARRIVVSTTTIVMYGGYTAVGLATFLAAVPLARIALGDTRYLAVVHLAAFSLVSQVFMLVPLAYLRLQNRFSLVIWASVIKLVLQVTANVTMLAALGYGARATFASTLLANGVVGLYLTGILLRGVGLHFSRAVASDLYRYGTPLILTQIAAFVLTFGDRYFLRHSTDLASVGRYTLAYQFAFLLMMLTQTPFELVWDPRKFEVAKRPDKDAVFSRMFVYLNVVCLTAGTAIALFAHVIIHVMTRRVYWGAAEVVPILVAGVVLQLWSTQDVGLSVRERTGYIAWANWIAAGATLAAYAILIPRYAAWGAASATVIGYGVRWGLAYRWSQQLWPVQYDWRPVRRVLALAVGAVLIGLVLPNAPVIVAAALRVPVYAIYLLLVWHGGILTEQDRAGVRRIFSQSLAALTQLRVVRSA